MIFKPTKIIIHCSDSPNHLDIGLKEITQWHLERGFESVGYHLIIRRDGTVENGRPLNQAGAHCQGENHSSFGICLVGKDKFTSKQFHALRYKLDSLVLTYDIDRHQVCPHSQFESAIAQGKTCPNIPGNVLSFWFNSNCEKCLQPYTIS